MVSDASVELAGLTVVVVLPTVWVMTTRSVLHRSVALVPAMPPLWVHVPAARVNALAGAVPELVMVTVVLVDWPGTRARTPPYLLIVAQVAELVPA
ncbi:hypothetical protein SAMN04488544_1018 [Microlunatus sagamiharensis]|uniref:Uncharacterized protein n=1 Tax=Microlunatus sagamiharensis TaxID=546874 RepID=A0A1H2LY86_9ACTN|nr:hypothetical protein SAMN04488544_1018 [Microlunatus sagamiharensis]